MAQLDQKVSNDLVKELKDISPPLADSQGDILVEEVQKAVKNDLCDGTLMAHSGVLFIFQRRRAPNVAGPGKTFLFPSQWAWFQLTGRGRNSGASFRRAGGVYGPPRIYDFSFFSINVFSIKRETTKMSTALPLQEQ